MKLQESSPIFPASLDHEERHCVSLVPPTRGKMTYAQQVANNYGLCTPAELLGSAKMDYAIDMCFWGVVGR